VGEKDRVFNKDGGTMAENCCKTCKFLSQKFNNQAFFPAGCTQGRCRRHAPLKTVGGWPGSGYPIVDHDEWCGDYEEGTNPDKEEEFKKE
jgi:hypothetical protein